MDQNVMSNSDAPVRENTVSQETSVNAQQPNDAGEKIVIAHSHIPSPLEETLIEFGKNLVKDSVSQSVEFNKTMLGLTATFVTLMASSFGLLAFGSKDKQLDNFQRVFLVIPVLFMLFSSLCFALGYYPRQVKLKLQVLNTIESARDNLLRTRRNWAFTGILFFALSIFTLIVGIILFNMN